MSRDNLKIHSPIWLLVLLVSGLLDPIHGVVVKLFSCVIPLRIPARADSPSRRRRGLTIILGGIEGPSPYNYNIAIGILKSGYRGAVVNDPWNAGLFLLRSLLNLTSPRHHQTQAARIVQRLTDHARDYPGSPIHIVAQSGGCWITIRVLETLPGDVKIQSAHIIAPSISPGCDIRRAANRCETHLVSYGSAGDFFFLGIGTMLFGTSDRKFSPSSGLVGWHYQCDKFIEARWHPEWLSLRNFGNHTTSAARNFVRVVIAPKLKDRQNLLQTPAAARLKGDRLA